MSLFNDSTFGKQKRVSRGPACGACKLLKHCQNPKLPVQGQGDKGVLIVLEGPTIKDDSRGCYAEALRVVAPMLARAGLDVNRDCWVTGAAICATKSKEGHKVEHAHHCRPILDKTIDELQPRLIIPIGTVACSGVIQSDFSMGASPMADLWTSEVIPSQKLNAYIVPLYDWQEWVYTGNVHVVERMVNVIGSLQGRPWDNGLPKLRDTVNVIYDPEEAAQAILDYSRSPKPVAFDIECNTLRPSTHGSELYTIGFSDGVTTVAMPWYPEVQRATKSLLLAHEHPCIAANMKFEYGWIWEKLGFQIPNLIWDTMLCSHHLQQRSGITGLKFQAYAKFGQSAYNDSVEPYFKGKPWELNRIAQVDQHELLIYNGMDAILELMLAVVQRRQYAELAGESQFMNIDCLLPRNLRESHT